MSLSKKNAGKWTDEMMLPPCSLSWPLPSPKSFSVSSSASTLRPTMKTLAPLLASGGSVSSR